MTAVGSKWRISETGFRIPAHPALVPSIHSVAWFEPVLARDLGAIPWQPHKAGIPDCTDRIRPVTMGELKYFSAMTFHHHQFLSGYPMNFVSLSPSLAIPIVIATAAGYALATVGMKSAAEGNAQFGLSVAICGFAIALIAEILLMRRFDVSIVYVSIIAAETVLVLAYAHHIGEGLGLRQMAGALLVIGGIALVTH
ncbi:hypothetical protein ACN2XU_15700 [Primorskyibacter sp. 2E107]|uniref:hypothetical protein n=1 Tax=Primorskyibacter sp. 2E107 TaxID=3403458 RepID=UPI003AF4F1B0